MMSLRSRQRSPANAVRASRCRIGRRGLTSIGRKRATHVKTSTRAAESTERASEHGVRGITARESSRVAVGAGAVVNGLVIASGGRERSGRLKRRVGLAQNERLQFAVGHAPVLRCAMQEVVTRLSGRIVAEDVRQMSRRHSELPREARLRAVGSTHLATKPRDDVATHALPLLLDLVNNRNRINHAVQSLACGQRNGKRNHASSC